MAESRVVEMRAASGATADSPGAAGPAVSSARREPAAAAEAFEEAFIEAEEPRLITSSTMHAQRPGPKSYVFAPPPRHHRAVDPACGAPGTHPSGSVSKSVAKKPQARIGGG